MNFLFSLKPGYIGAGVILLFTIIGTSIILIRYAKSLKHKRMNKPQQPIIKEEQGNV